MTPEEEKVYAEIFGKSLSGPTALPAGGTVDASGAQDPYAVMGQDAVRYDAPGGGYAIIPQRAVQENPVLRETVATGKPRMQREEERQQQEHDRIVENFLRNSARRDRAEKVKAAEARKAEGTMTVGDALVLNIPIPRKDGMTAQESLDQMFNVPTRRDREQERALGQAVVMEGVGAGTLVPEVGQDGKVTGYRQNLGGAKGKPQVFNTGRGLFERNPEDGSWSIVPGSVPPPADTGPIAGDPLFTTYAGSPVVQKDGFLYTWQDGKGYVNPKPMEEGPDLEGLSSEMKAVMTALGKGAKIDYSKVPELKAAPAGEGQGAEGGQTVEIKGQSTIDGMDAGQVVQQFIDANPGMSPAEAEQEARQRGYIK